MRFGLLIAAANPNRCHPGDFPIFTPAERRLFSVVLVQTTFVIDTEFCPPDFEYLPPIEDYDSNAVFMNHLVDEAMKHAHQVDYWIHLNAGESLFPDVSNFVNTINQLVVQRIQLRIVELSSSGTPSPPQAPQAPSHGMTVSVPLSLSICVFNRTDTLTSMKIRVVHKNVFNHYHYVGDVSAHLRPRNVHHHHPLQLVSNLQVSELMITIDDQTCMMYPDFDLINFKETLCDVQSVNVRRNVLYQLTYYQYMRRYENMETGCFQYSLWITNLLQSITLYVRTRRYINKHPFPSSTIIPNTEFEQTCPEDTDVSPDRSETSIPNMETQQTDTCLPSSPSPPTTKESLRNCMHDPFDPSKVFENTIETNAEKATVLDLLTDCFEHVDPFIYSTLIFATDLFIEWYYEFSNLDHSTKNYSILEKKIKMYRDMILWGLILMEEKYRSMISPLQISRIEHFYYLVMLNDTLPKTRIRVTTSKGTRLVVLHKELDYYVSRLTHFPIISPFPSYDFCNLRTRIYDYERWQALIHHGFGDTGHLLSEIYLSCQRRIPNFCSLSRAILQAYDQGIYYHMYNSLTDRQSVMHVIRNQLQLLEPPDMVSDDDKLDGEYTSEDTSEDTSSDDSVDSTDREMPDVPTPQSPESVS